MEAVNRKACGPHLKSMLWPELHIHLHHSTSGLIHARTLFRIYIRGGLQGLGLTMSFMRHTI